MEQKTEQATPKKKEDSAKEGTAFKSEDATMCVQLVVGGAASYYFVDLRELFALFEVFRTGDVGAFNAQVMTGALDWFVRTSLIVVGACAGAATLFSVLQTRFSIATKVLKIDFNRFNPVTNLKQLFSMRTLKNGVKSIVYFTALGAGLWLFLLLHASEILALKDAHHLLQLGALTLGLIAQLGVYLVLSVVALIALDAISEFLLYLKDLMMSKQEVKQEREDAEGKQETKSRRRELAHELLSDSQKSDIAGSKFMLANPTHIAIGIYVNESITPLPFVSFVGTDAVALKAIEHAKKCGVPVVRDVALARAMYPTAKKYSFVRNEWLVNVLSILDWLRDVEQQAKTPQDEPGAQDDEPTAPPPAGN